MFEIKIWPGLLDDIWDLRLSGLDLMQLKKIEIEIKIEIWIKFKTLTEKRISKKSRIRIDGQDTHGMQDLDRQDTQDTGSRQRML